MEPRPQDPAIRRFRLRLLMVLAAALALPIGLAVLYHYPPSEYSFYPRCPFNQVTGLHCPGCGLTRGTYQLLHGHVGAALSYNIFTPVAIAAIVIVWLSWVRTSWGGQPTHLAPRAARWLAILTPALLLVYGVLRNVPVAPLRALAP